MNRLMTITSDMFDRLAEATTLRERGAALKALVYAYVGASANSPIFAVVDDDDPEDNDWAARFEEVHRTYRLRRRAPWHVHNLRTYAMALFYCGLGTDAVMRETGATRKHCAQYSHRLRKWRRTLYRTN